MSQNEVYLRQIEVGPMANFVYLIGDPATRKAAVIDPAWDIDTLLNEAATDGYTIEQILVTHYHQDHLGGVMMGHSIAGAVEMASRTGSKVYTNKHEADGVKLVTGLSDSDLVKVDAGDVLKIGSLEIRFLHTPGHTPGSQCFLAAGCLVSGDTLFVDSCGRVDLPGSDPEQMYYSLNHTLRDLDDSTVVYPGHNYAAEPNTTIGRQKTSNPFMRFSSVDEFLRAMGYGHR